MPQQANYLQNEVYGGVRRAGDYATTRMGPLVPGPAAQLDEFGNLPQDFVAYALADPNVRWVQLKPGAPPALVRIKKGEEMQILAVIAHQSTARSRRYRSIRWFSCRGEGAPAGLDKRRRRARDLT